MGRYHKKMPIWHLEINNILKSGCNRQIGSDLHVIGCYSCEIEMHTFCSPHRKKPSRPPICFWINYQIIKGLVIYVIIHRNEAWFNFNEFKFSHAVLGCSRWNTAVKVCLWTAVFHREQPSTTCENLNRLKLNPASFLRMIK